MDSQGLSLNQCGQTSINIFPTHPEIQAYSKQNIYEPTKEGFKKQQEYTYVKVKKQKEQIVAYQVYSDYGSYFHIHEAQNVGDVLSDMMRSLQFSMRNVLTTLNSFKVDLDKDEQ